jgi:hypothetical protein
MRRWLGLLVAMAVIAGAGLFAASRTVGLASIRGTVAGGAMAIREARVVLLQGPMVQALSRMDAVTPGTELKFNDGSTATWTTTDGEGNFEFTRVRAEKSSITGLIELLDGRICATSHADVEPLIRRVDVQIRLNHQRCWERRPRDPRSANQ